ncbi:MAG: DUF721 domain-containing protein [Pseudomonadota bacterium]|nr:DUF721 domain-containing protein [Pseudomonadota bacterium]
MTIKRDDKNFFQTKQLGWYVSKIAKPFFNRQGFVKGYIIDNWEEIVGENYYKISIPEKLRIQKGGGILTIATDGATATEMEYIKDEIIRKVNDYYGYRAISRIRFRNSYLQGLENKQEKKTNKKKLKTQSISVLVNDFEEGKIKEAISSLGRYIINKKD